MPGPTWLPDHQRVRIRAGDEPPVHDTITRLIQQGRDREAAELGAVHLSPSTRGVLMDPIEQLDAIVPLLNTLVAELDDTDLGAPTPCDEFDVRRVLEHMIGGATMFAAAFRDSTPGAPPSGDVIEAFPVAMADLGAAIAAPGALDRTINAPFGQVPGETFARFVALDGLV